MKKAIVLVLLTIGLQSPTLGQVTPTRTIGVVGESEVLVPPAQVVVSVGIDTFDDDITVTRAERDSILRLVMTSIGEMGIERDDIETSGFSIRPRHEHQRGARILTGYESSVWITVTLDRVDDLESYITNVLTAGATQVRTVEFIPENEDEALARAQSIALQDARDTAERMAAELGASLGPVLSIKDEGFCRLADCGKESAIMASSRVVPSTAATGVVKVVARVLVEFELEVPGR